MSKKTTDSVIGVHRYITTALVVISATILIYRLLSHLKRVILLKVPKVEAQQKLDTEKGIMRATVDASNTTGSTGRTGNGNSDKNSAKRKTS